MSFLDIFRGRPHAKSTGGPWAEANPQPLAWQIYRNEPPWAHEDGMNGHGAGLGAQIAAEIARLTLQEAAVTVPDDIALETFLQKEALPEAARTLEAAWALGGAIFKPRLSAYAANAGTRVLQAPKCDAVLPTHYEIKAHEGNLITLAHLYDTRAYAGAYYTRIETHTFNDGKTTIANSAVKTQRPPSPFIWDFSNAEPVPLTDVPAWKSVPRSISFTGATGPLFGYYSPVPIGAEPPLVRAATQIKGADKTYNALCWEIEASLARLFIDEVLIPDSVGGKDPRLPRHIMKLLGGDASSMFERFAPEIRADGYLRVWNAHLMHVENALGLSHGTLSEMPVTARTATEIVASQHRTFALIQANQRALQTALEQLAAALALWRGTTLTPLYFDFDDSIFTNPRDQLPQLLQLQAAGNIPAWRVNQQYFNVPEAEAKALAAEARAEEQGRMASPAENGFE